MQGFFPASHNTSFKEVNGRTWINGETVVKPLSIKTIPWRQNGRPFLNPWEKR